MNPTNMLELQKLVLENVYENKSFFVKELQKSFQWLDHEDLNILYRWAIEKFSEQYRKIIDCMFLGFDLQNSNNILSYIRNIG
jgi:hypothetical protein